MARVTGIGGIFFKSKDPEALKKWYLRHLGIESRKSDVGARFDWQESTEPHRSAYTVWAPFRHDTRYFDPSKQSFMFQTIHAANARMCMATRGDIGPGHRQVTGTSS